MGEGPILYVKMQVATLFLEKGNQKVSKKLLEEGKSALDNMVDVDASVHCSYSDLMTSTRLVKTTRTSTRALFSILHKQRCSNFWNHYCCTLCSLTALSFCRQCQSFEIAPSH
ncbi:hypothetical protein BS78_K112100 [Paspalum vaginatum]|uniref:Uncharacterized protein n=1 Tax=Paspalum vaginatum TaxID=158149 RepID=A0A9W7X9S5_9POAL|nr:hypothetical protein BS78_K112100 [Paspalum vaginatum]